MIKPDSLKQGDCIGFAATARKISPEEINYARDYFEQAGLRVKFSPTLFEEENQFGGSDELRIKGFQTLLNDPEVKAILIARGGYGTVRIIDQLNFDALKEQPKWIAGFSDITVLHSHIQQNYGIQTLHSPMCLNFMPERFDELSIHSLVKHLMSEDSIIHTSEIHSLNRKGDAQGILCGGNLSVLYSLLGSASSINTEGKILFLEDLDEYLYHIDRMMINMKRNGILSGLAGLIVGDMSNMKDNAIPFGKTAYEIIAEHVDEYKFPVCFGFPAGHEKRNLSLRMGANSVLKISDKGSTLSY